METLSKKIEQDIRRKGIIEDKIKVQGLRIVNKEVKDISRMTSGFAYVEIVLSKS